MLESVDKKRLREAFEAISDRASSGAAVYQVMSEAIVNGEIPDHMRLTELDVAKIFAVSRTPIREALARLESDRLAVRDSSGRLVVVGLTRQQVLDIYAVREVLDGLGARLACEFRTALEIADLRRLNEEMELAARDDDYVRMAELNVEFHDLIAAASHNEFLQRFGREVHRTVRRFKSTTFESPGRADTALKEHGAIITAIELRRPEDADHLAREHMRHAAQVRIDMYSGNAGALPARG